MACWSRRRTGSSVRLLQTIKHSFTASSADPRWRDAARRSGRNSDLNRQFCPQIRVPRLRALPKSGRWLGVYEGPTMHPVLSYFGRTRSLKANLPIDVVLATEFGRPIVEGIVGSGPAYR